MWNNHGVDRPLPCIYLAGTTVENGSYMKMMKSLLSNGMPVLLLLTLPLPPRHLPPHPPGYTVHSTQVVEILWANMIAANFDFESVLDHHRPEHPRQFIISIDCCTRFESNDPFMLDVLGEGFGASYPSNSCPTSKCSFPVGNVPFLLNQGGKSRALQLSTLFVVLRVLFVECERFSFYWRPGQ